MFEWDKDKANGNILKHSVTFTFATLAFEDPHKIVLIDNRFDYQEIRYIVLSKIDTRVYVVVYTMRNTEDNETVIRIISARKANEKEIKRYDNNQLYT